jgi:hypothetical protein
MKKKTLRALIDDVAKLLQKHVRLKAAVAADKNGFIECVSCNKWFHWKDMQGGHWIERGKQATKIMEENIHPQCKGCNQYGMRHRTHVREGYSKFMRDMYGDDFCDQMLVDSRKPIKYFRPDLEDMVKELRRKNRELEDAI